MWHAGASLAAVSAYEEKIGIAARLQVILWDMVKSCRRTTSADDALEIVALNDIAALLQVHPEIERIGLNGTRASELFLKHVVYGCDFRQAREALSGVGGRVVLAVAGKTRAIYRLPSTSPVPTLHYRTIEDKWTLWQRFFY
jgi:G:T/U-mismatch repair DNA glycosylase